MTQRSIALLLLGLVAGTAAASGETTLDVRVSAAVDLYQFVRTQAEREAPEVHEVYHPAIEAARKVDAKLEGIFLGWGFLDRELVGVERAGEIVERFDGLPEAFRLRSGNEIVLRDEAIAFATELAKVEGRFRQHEWAEHRDVIEQARNGLEKHLVPKQQEAFDFMLDSLGMKDPGHSIPVYLVAEAPDPGAFTYGRPGGGGICFVGVRELQGPMLHEIVLHEATHALDVASGGQNVFEELRAMLEQAGVDRRDRLWRDVPHTIMFIQAGETVRRLLHPEHTHYGDGGYYDIVRKVADVELPLWKRHLDGKLGREQALRQIVEAVTAGR
jgi:hypothetical protein